VRRFLRILLNAATVLLFAIFTATVTLWVRTYRASDGVEWDSVTHGPSYVARNGISTSRGAVCVYQERRDVPGTAGLAERARNVEWELGATAQHRPGAVVDAALYVRAILLGRRLRDHPGGGLLSAAVRLLAARPYPDIRSLLCCRDSALRPRDCLSAPADRPPLWPAPPPSSSGSQLGRGPLCSLRLRPPRHARPMSRLRCGSDHESREAQRGERVRGEVEPAGRLLPKV
jgi:hypothetical protein